MVTALNVANNVLRKSFNENIDITPMKLQKMIYLIYKQYYKLTNKALFPEKFETWKYGPVIREVYDEFKEYKANAIKRYAIEKDGSILIVKEENAPQFKETLESIWKKYKQYDGIRLSEMTHREGTAWWKAAINKRETLSDEDIREEDDFIE